MPDSLYMSFNQEFSGKNEYPSSLICPSVSYSFWSDTPDISFQVGQSLLWNDVLTAQIKGNYNKNIPTTTNDTEATDNTDIKTDYDFVITKIHISDEVIGERNGYPFRQWLVTLDGYINHSKALQTEDETAPGVIINSYSVDVEKLENDDTLFQISIETINYGQEPVIIYSIGDTEASSAFFSDIPGAPLPFTCTSYSYSDSFNELNMHVWTVVYKGFALLPHEQEGDDEQDDEDTSISYEINGSGIYTVDGNIIALRRSEAPIVKKTFTKYSDSSDRITTPGAVYQGGIVLSESIIKETINSSYAVAKTYYKHTIEIEGIANTSETSGDTTDS